MPTSYDTAVDDIFGVLDAAWSAGSTAIVGYVPELKWPGVEREDLPDNSTYYGQVELDTVSQKQVSFRTGSNGMRFSTTGFLSVVINCPKSSSVAAEKGRLLSELVQNAFRGTQTINGVWFKNTVINELTSDFNFVRYRVMTEFIFDEIMV